MTRSQEAQHPYFLGRGQLVLKQLSGIAARQRNARMNPRRIIAPCTKKVVEEAKHIAKEAHTAWPSKMLEMEHCKVYKDLACSTCQICHFLGAVIVPNIEKVLKATRESSIIDPNSSDVGQENVTSLICKELTTS